MKRFCLLITLIVSTLATMAQPDTWFAYPTAPEALPYGRPRANYLVYHFWDRVPWKTAYSSTRRMEEAVRDFANYLPHAAADTVYLSVNKLIKETSKRHDDLASLINIARSVFHSDTAELYSDDVYLPFALAGVKDKKLPAELRERCTREARVIETCAEGKTLPDIKITAKDGSKIALNDTTTGAETYVLILERPDDSLSRFERVRFANNYAVDALVDGGLLNPVIIYAGTPDEVWWKSVETLPANWTVGYMPDADSYFDIRMSPSVYVLDRHMRIDSKLMPLPTLTANCERLINSVTHGKQQ